MLYLKIKKIWKKDRIVSIDKDFIFYPPETEIRKGEKYALYGTGGHGEIAYNILKESGGELLFAVDSDNEKWGREFHGIKIEKPEVLIENEKELDHVIIGTIYHYKEVKDRIYEIIKNHNWLYNLLLSHDNK